MSFNDSFVQNYRLFNNNNNNFSFSMDDNEDADRLNWVRLNDFPSFSIADEDHIKYQFSYDFRPISSRSPINDTTQINQETAPRTRTVQNININLRNKNKIFAIKKVKKNLGRKRANSAHKNDDDKNVHTKYKDDNIRKVIIRGLSAHIKTHENNLLKKSDNPNLNSLELLKVKSSAINVHKKEDFLALLDTQTKDLYSNEVSKKYLESKKNNNKITISQILEQKDKTLNDSLNSTFEYFLNIYVGKEKRNAIFIDFPYIEEDMEILKAKGHDENYVNKYKFYAEHFREKIEDIDERTRRRIENED